MAAPKVTGVPEVDEILMWKQVHGECENKNDALWNALLALANMIHDLKKEVSDENKS